MKLKMKNFPYSDYVFYINNYQSTCYTNHYDGEENKEFFEGMLYLSQYRCFYCGQSLIINSTSGVYYEKEHIINKKYYGRNKKTTKADENKALNKCKYNLIPICKTCNSLKKHIIASNDLINRLNNLETLDKCKEKKIKPCAEFSDCFDDFRMENFNPFNNDIEFDILHKIYIGDTSYISQFQLNSRTKTLFLNLFNILYDMTFNFPNGDFIIYLKSFSTNSLEDKIIDYLKKIRLIDDYGTKNSSKLNSLIEAIVLLEEFS